MAERPETRDPDTETPGVRSAERAPGAPVLRLSQEPPPGWTTPFTVRVYGAYCWTCSVGSS
ncbi:hypothetical protein GCM10010199_51530 [Dactylosporangium roseum]